MASPPVKPVQAPKARGGKSGGGLGRRNLLLLGGGLAVAVVVAVVLIVVSLTGSKTKAKPVAAGGGPAIATLFRGIPQDGIYLGSPKAPVTLVEYADLQCPFCAEFEERSLPTVVSRYVRTGKVRLEFRGLAFVGPDSTTGLQTVIAAGSQDKLWNVLALVYRNQGTENTGWVTDDFLRSILAAVPGLDADRVLAERTSNTVADQMLAAQQRATAASIDSTPTFEVGRTGGALQVVRLTTLDPSGITAALDSALAG